LLTSTREANCGLLVVALDADPFRGVAPPLSLRDRDRVLADIASCRSEQKLVAFRATRPGATARTVKFDLLGRTVLGG
jgi:hypothetical protein